MNVFIKDKSTKMKYLKNSANMWVWIQSWYNSSLEKLEDQ